MKNFWNYATYIRENFEVMDIGKKIVIKAGGETIEIEEERFKILNFKNYEHSRIFNLKIEENWSVLILLLKLFARGYKAKEITLEKTWKLGHDKKGSLDIMISRGKTPFHLIEVKTSQELEKYTNVTNNMRKKRYYES
ncbi:hypothetical protein MYMA111404_02285 [Mycoplasma marinum]|uniref:hypothetical protein n=1 Tax=Mycoplasma marinum TaxID=1937190 RepID=UPI003B31B238